MPEKRPRRKGPEPRFTERTNIQFSPEQLTDLRRLSRIRGRTLAGEVRDAVDAHLARFADSLRERG